MIPEIEKMLKAWSVKEAMNDYYDKEINGY